jgi:exopolysaccharide biosynthesis polyprenyl glycosylphosphotransferase
VGPTDTLVRSREEEAGAERMLPYDVRLRREITHRRLAFSLARRAVRVFSLHLLDGVLLGATAYAMARAWGNAAAARPLVPAVVLIFLLGLNALSAYDPGDARRDRKRLASGVVLGSLILACLVAFPPHVALTYPFLAALGLAAFVALSLGRKGVDLLVRQAYVRGFGLRRAVIVGSLDEAGRALRQLRDGRNIDQYVVGHLAVDAGSDPAALGSVGDLRSALDRLDVQEVLVAAVLSPERMREVTECCFERGVSLFVMPSVAGNVDCWAEPLRVGECPLLRLHPARLEMPSLLIKRGVDVALAGTALLLLAPVVALLALFIKLDSPGPVFFRQERVGLGGRRFTMWKFRSMTADAEARELELAHLNIYGGNGTFKLRQDPRVTRMGRLLRRTSMDEIPQLLNVLRGEMSIVGPRPALLSDIVRYQPHHFERLTVVPGMTGPWQVGGRNLITDFETIVKMERDYIATWSLLLDLKIMARTVGVVLRGEGAY